MVSYEKAAEHSMLSDLICKREKKNIIIKNSFSCHDMTLCGRDDLWSNDKSPHALPTHQSYLNVIR